MYNCGISFLSFSSIRKSGKLDKVKYADKKMTVYTVLHNSNLEIHGFWPKALQMHGFLKKNPFST